ncbi:NGB-like protein [Mya arenaria]|uniref:NGB-like protein n=1 Tax=Mya arenaria TaxID=6604 RepID=A0ABY7FEE6_MYAAR|nr:neuroglobin-like [Mya arenaria]WAR19739.1 NGB-like protein [Mya arenaria]
MGNKMPNCAIPYSSRDKHLHMVLSTEQVKLVQGSWELLKDDLGRLGLIVFLRLFEMEPQMKTVFPKIVQMNHDNKLETNIVKDMLQRHAVTVMEGLGAAVESLDDSRILNSVLISIGQTHVQRQVKPQMVKKLWPSLNYGLQEVLEENYTKNVAEAWKTVYDYICVYMKMGMENPDIDPDITSEIGR